MAKKTEADVEAKPVEQLPTVDVEEIGGLEEVLTAQVVEVATIAKSGKDRVRAVLTDEEIEEVKEKARAQILKEKREFAKKLLLEQELAKLREVEGVGGVADDMVRILIDLPVFAADLKINNQPYIHGRWYTVPRHVGWTLQEMMWRAKKHQAIDIKGAKWNEFYRSPRQTVVSAQRGIINAPVAPR